MIIAVWRKTVNFCNDYMAFHAQGIDDNDNIENAADISLEVDETAGVDAFE